MNAATFYKHCGYNIICILKVSVKILHPIILDCKFPSHWNWSWVSIFYNFFGNYGISINVSLARVIRNLQSRAILATHAGLAFLIYLYILICNCFVPRPAQLFQICSGTGVKSSLMTRKYTYFRKNRVQIRKSPGNEARKEFTIHSAGRSTWHWYQTIGSTRGVLKQCRSYWTMVAFNEQILASQRPNFFELLAQEAMREALRPAFEYVCKVGMVNHSIWLGF